MIVTAMMDGADVLYMQMIQVMAKRTIVTIAVTEDDLKTIRRTNESLEPETGCHPNNECLSDACDGCE